MGKTIVKKIIAIILVVAAVMSFAACKKKNGGSSTETPEENPAPITPDVTVEAEPALTGINIVENGRSDYKILLAADRETCEENAANELVSYISKITGVKLKVVDEAEHPVTSTSGKYIALGRTKLYKAQNWETGDLNGDGYVLKTVNSTLFILGNIGRGTLYGAYEFLEREAGCRFLTANYEYVPTRDTIPLRKLDVKAVPAISDRTIFYFGTRNEYDFSAKRHFLTYGDLNLHRPADVERVGGVRRSRWNADYHSFGLIVPFNEYGAAHPDWYNAGATSDMWQPCFSNGLNDDGTLQEGDTLMNTLIQNVTEQVIANPDLDMFALCEQDHAVFCNCDRCIEQCEKLGGSKDRRAGQFVLMANTVAREVKKRLAEAGVERPNLKFAVSAYTATIAPPTDTDENGNVTAHNPLAVPADDVYVYFAWYGGCALHPLDDPDCSVNAGSYAKYFRDWMAITDRFVIWDYQTDFSNYYLWHPGLLTLQANLQFYDEMGVDSLLSEYASTGSSIYREELSIYVESKLMWDPYIDVNAARAEFDRYYFGEKAGAIITEFGDFMNGHIQKMSGKNGVDRCISLYTAMNPWICETETLNEPFLRKALEYVEQAEAAIEGDDSLSYDLKEQYKLNLLRVKFQVMYMCWYNYDAVLYTDDETKYEFMHEFIDIGDRIQCLAIGDADTNKYGSFKERVLASLD